MGLMMRLGSPHILAGLGALLLVLVPAPAAAHQRLLHTSPESGAEVHTAPSELRLAFNEAVELAFTTRPMPRPSLRHQRIVLPRVSSRTSTTRHRAPCI
jgi:methionine-rich copper-binding protein CopC